MNTTCTVCQRPLVLKPGGTKRDGTTYKPFMGCEVWDDEHKRARDDYKKAKGTFKPSPKTQNAPVSSLNEESVQMIMDELEAINKRLNDMAHFLVDKLGGDKKNEINIGDIKF